MTTHDAPAEAPPPAPAAPPGTDRLLTRSRDSRVISGVCGGLGRYCGVDPVLFRIGLGVLVFFGGAGAVIYLAAWLFLPEDGETASPAEALLGRGHSGTSTLTTVILAVLGIIALGIALHGESLVLLALAVLGIILLARRGPLMSHPAGDVGPSGGHPSAAAAPVPVPAAYAPHGPYGGSVGAEGTAPAPTPPHSTLTLPATLKPLKPPKPPKSPKERSALGRIVVSATLLVLGLMLAADRGFDVSIATAWYPAAALAMVGAGLIAGAWLGRARGLIALGFVLCIVLPVMTAATSWDTKDMGNQLWSPQSASEIEPAYKVGFGEGTLNLTQVNFVDATTRTRANVGFGHLLVRVPKDVDVTVRGSAGAGNLDLFGEQTNGSGVHHTVTDLGADGAGGGTLNLDVEVGFGELEVIRD